MISKRRYMHGKRRRRSPIRQEDGLTLEKAGILLGESYMPGSYEQVGGIKAEQGDSDLSTKIDFPGKKKKKDKKPVTRTPEQIMGIDPKSEIKGSFSTPQTYTGGFGPKPPSIPK
tara:strand:- start:381 stop:725 length:345 start_codon:yes stop_codon:yes gene_type:complete